jgi:atypical dual specificity phosphatase
MSPMNHVLTIKNLRLGYGNEEVLCINDLKISKHRITGLLGPSGCGKSSLLSAILRDSSSLSYWEEGELYLENEILDKKRANKLIAFVPQKARLYTDTILANFLDGFSFKSEVSLNQKKQLVVKIFKTFGVWELFKDIIEEPVLKQSLGIHKILLIIKALAKKPKLLLIDEVLASTSLKDEVIIIDLIKKLSKDTSVLLITHNKEEAKDLCDSIALVSGGVLHEHTAVDQFFQQPQSEIGHEFLETGSAWYLNPNTKVENKEDDLTALRRFSSICEFYWVILNKIGGMQKPGLMTEIEDDLAIMKQLGVNVLVTLQQNPIDTQLLGKYEIEGIHFPIVDMGVPDLEKTHQFLMQVQIHFEASKSIVYHCKAGMGRTGTMLACNLVYSDNITAIYAIEKIRRVNYKYIQTDEQMQFVSDFEKYLKSV